MSETQAAPQLSGKMFLFEKPELINKDQHGELGFQRPERQYEFCANIRAVPVTVSEIPAAMKDYPIVFMAQDNLLPLAIVGLIDDVNLFVDEDGNWEPNRYVPGYIRRYPFGVANDASNDRFAVVIDREYKGLVAGGSPKLFENGELSDATKQAVDFCSNFERDRKMTEEFAKRLQEFDLVTGQNGQYTPVGASEPITFAQYLAVEEQKLKDLSDDKLLDLHKSGMLPILHAMVMSMGNWRPLMQRRAKRFNLSEADFMNKAIN